jgi:glyceraldehyde-3-phosphate dehydrogenase/erythrose-4-phosphate dehydrogenase
VSRKCAEKALLWNARASVASAATAKTLPSRAPLHQKQNRFKYDTVHGKFEGDLRGDKDGLWVNGKKITTFAQM